MQDTFDLQKYFEDRKILFEFNSFFSLSNGIQESGKKPVFMHKIKYASTDQDFELIYQRELEKANCKDTTAFKEMLEDKVLKLRNNEWMLDPDARAPFLDLQNIADKFIEWISDRNNKTKQKPSFEKCFKIEANANVIMEALKELKVIDNSGMFIEPSRGNALFLYGIVTGLQQKNYLTEYKPVEKENINLIYKIFCKKINRPHTRAYHIKEAGDIAPGETNAYLNGKDKIWEYLNTYKANFPK